MHFVHPFRCIASGPSQAGKTEFVKQVLLGRKYLISGNEIEHIVWCCKSDQFVPAVLHELENFSTYEGVPSMSIIKPNTIVVLDDLMTEGISKELCQLFTVASHHLAVSIFYITHNIFYQGSLNRDISLSSNILVCFKNPRDKSQFNILARQLSPENWRSLVEVYKEATHQPFGYLFIDLTQQINDLLRYKTNILNRDYFECFSLSEDDITKNTTVSEIEKVPILIANAFTEPT